MSEQENDRTTGGVLFPRPTDDDVEQEPIRVETREEFDDAVVEMFRTGRPIEAPSVETLEQWGVDLEDEGGGIEER